MTTTLARAAGPVTRGDEDPTLHAYGAFVGRYRLLLVAALLVGIAAGMAFHFTQPVRYTSTAHMVIVATTVSTSLESDSDVSIDSALQLLRSDQVLGQAAQRIGYPGGSAALNDDLTTRPIVNSRIVRVSVSALDPGTAQEAANAVTARFFEVRANGLERVAEGRAGTVAAEIDIVEAELARRYGIAEEDSGAVDAERVVTGIAPLVALRAQLHGEQAALAISEPDPGYLSRPATEPLRGARSGLAITMSSAVTLSMLAAVGLGALHHLRLQRRATGPVPRTQGVSDEDL